MKAQNEAWQEALVLSPERKYGKRKLFKSLYPSTLLRMTKYTVLDIIIPMTIDEIRHAFGGRLVGTKILKENVCEVVALLPQDLQEYVTEYVWFVGSMEDAWGYTFTGNDLADQHLIFLGDDLLREDKDQIHWSIAHEIGHVVLGHKNNIFVKQSKVAIGHQEEEADEFASKYA